MEHLKSKYIEFILKTKGVSEGYAKVSSLYLDRFIQFLKDRNITDIKGVSRARLMEYQEKIFKMSLTSATKRSALNIVALFFRYLYDYGSIDEDIGIIIDLPRLEDRIPRSIMNEAEITFITSLPDENDLIGLRDICIMKLLYSSAMRPKEVFSLSLGDINFRNNQVLVRRPKNKRDRVVNFDHYTAQFLKRYINNARPWLLRGKPSELVFVTVMGGKLAVSSWGTYFRNKYSPVFQRKFNKKVTPYSFRHSSATHWLDSGAKHKRDILCHIQRQLGHENLESTAIYTHVAIEPLREMFRKYHPRDLSLQRLNKIPSPDDIISGLKKKRGNSDGGK